MRVTSRKFAWFVAPIVSAGALGCGGSAGQNPDLVGGGDDAGTDGGFGSEPGADASSSALHVTVSPAAPVLCPGDCVALSAKAGGGLGPYSYTWGDGTSGSGPVTVCPKATTTYTVTTTDSSGHGGEFPTPNAMASGSATATVKAECDAGTALPVGPCDSLAKSFSPNGVNPQANWSYGWSLTLGGTFTLYPTFVAQELDAGAFSGIGFPYIAQWFDKSLGDGTISSSGPVPDIQFNPSSMPVQPGNGNLTGDSWQVQPGQIVMAASAGGPQCSIARWKAPSQGTYTVKAAFTSPALPNFTDVADIHVQHNGTDLPSGGGGITATATTFSVTSAVTVGAGDTIDFIVAPSTGLTYRLVAVDAQVCGAAVGDGG
jgi:hypothetical protein